MATNLFEDNPNRVNYTVLQKGSEYERRLLGRAQTIFGTLLKLLPSSYKSSVQGPSYTVELKAVAVEIARLELALEDVSRDVSASKTRSEFLYSLVGYFLFLNGKIPTIQWDDRSFQDFMLKLLAIYYKGSIPAAILDLVKLVFKDSVVVVKENFLLVRAGASGLDISDQFGFQVDLNLSPSDGFPPDVFSLSSAIRQLLGIIRPAHTLFRLRFVFDDKYAPNPESGGVILDAYKWHLYVYSYEDLRVYGEGVSSVDDLGFQKNTLILGEDHTEDF
jgi:hypothetical protein